MTRHDSQQEELAAGRRLLLRHPPGLEDAQREDLEQAIREATEFQNSLAGQCDRVRLITDLMIDDSGFWVCEDPVQAAALETLTVQGAMDPGIVAGYGVQLCNALIDTCYRESEPPRPHGALRPLCVFVADDRILISEFGLAPALSRVIARDAAQEELDLLAPYIARELWQNPGAYGELRDLFAIGVMLYELTTGCHPFGAKRDDFEDCLERLQMGMNQPALVNQPTLEPALAEVLDRAVARREADRFESIRTLRDALVPFCTSPAAPRGSDSAGTEAIEASLGDQRAAFEQLCAPLRAGIYPQARVTTPLHRPASELVATILCFSTDEGDACIEVPLRWDAAAKRWQEQKPGSLTEACVERAGAELEVRLQRAVIEPSGLFSRHAQLLHFEFDRAQFDGEFPSLIRRAGALLYQRPGSGDFQALGKIDSQFPFELSKELARQARQAETTFEQVIQADKVKSAQGMLDELSAAAAPAQVRSEPRRLKNLPDEVSFTLEAAGTREILQILWTPDQGAYLKEPDWAAKLLRFQSGKSSALARPPKPVLATLLTRRRAVMATSIVLVLVVIAWFFWPSTLDKLRARFASVTSSIQPTRTSDVPTHGALADFINEANTSLLNGLLEELEPLLDPVGRPAENVEAAKTLEGEIDDVLLKMEAYARILPPLDEEPSRQIALFKVALTAWPTSHVEQELTTLILDSLKVAVASSEANECNKARGGLKDARQFTRNDVLRDDGLMDHLREEIVRASQRIEDACESATPDIDKKAVAWLDENRLPPPEKASHGQLEKHIENDVIAELKWWSHRLESAVVKATFDDLLQKFRAYDRGLNLTGKTLVERTSLLEKAQNAWATAEITEQLETHLDITNLLKAAGEKAEENWRCALSLLKQAREEAESGGMAKELEAEFDGERGKIKRLYRERTTQKLREAKDWLENEAGELPEKWEDRLAAVAHAEKAREFLDSLDHCPGDLDKDGLDYCVIEEEDCPADERTARKLIAKLLAWTTADLPVTRDAGESVTIALTFIPMDADGIIRAAFWMSQTEITVAQYREIMSDLPEEAGGCRQLGREAAGRHIDLNPVGCVLANETQQFCRALTERLGPQFEVDLPDTKEWKHALAAGRLSYREAGPWICRFDSDCRLTLIRERVNFESQELGRAFLAEHRDGYEHFAPATHYPPNCWMLYNMLGNADERVWDWDQTRSKAPAATLGGSFRHLVEDLTEARPDYHPMQDLHPGSGRNADIGFRITVRYDRSAVEESPNRD